MREDSFATNSYSHWAPRSPTPPPEYKQRERVAPLRRRGAPSASTSQPTPLPPPAAAEPTSPPPVIYQPLAAASSPPSPMGWEETPAASFVYFPFVGEALVVDDPMDWEYTEEACVIWYSPVRGWSWRELLGFDDERRCLEELEIQ